MLTRFFLASGLALLFVATLLAGLASAQTQPPPPPVCDFTVCNTTKCLLPDQDCPGPRSLCKDITDCDSCMCRKVQQACMCKL
jgi:hypothetical protein